MRLFRGGLAARPAFLLTLLFMLMVVRVSADTTADSATTTAATTDATTTDATSTHATSTHATSTDATTESATTTSLPSLSTSTSSESSSSSSSSTSTSTSTSTSSTDTSKSSSASGTSDVVLPSLPTLSSSAGADATYSYPAPSVPPTENAPYMRKSKAPEGTFFIAVGSALGFIGLVILAWRGMVAWSVNRSVRKAAMMQARAEKMALLRGKGRRRSRRRSSVYSQAPPGSNMSMEKLGTIRRTSYVPPVPKPSTKTSGLFYSPTAGVGMHGNSNRASTYLPAGYYASANAAPGGGSGMSFSGLGPQSQGYTRTGSAPSPPASPLLSPNRGHDSSYQVSQARMSSTSLNVPPQGRTPSTYLEDLFDNHAPGSDIEHK